VLHQVNRTQNRTTVDAVEQFIGDLLNSRPQLFHRARRVGLAGQLSQLVWSGGSFSSMFTFSDDACEPSVPGGKSAMARAWSLLSLGSLSSALASA